MATIKAFLILCLTAGFILANSSSELIVRLDPGVTPDEVLADYGEGSVRVVRQLSRRMNIWLFENSSRTRALSRVKNSLALQGGVDVVQENHTISLRKAPGDPQFSDQWALNNSGQGGGTVGADIDALKAWDLTTGGITVDGQEVVIAVIDDGFDLLHEDISYWKNSKEIPNNNIDDDNNGYVDDYHGWNAYDSNGDISSATHGTHVSGIAAAIGNNTKGVTGVNWGAKIMPISGSTTNESIVIEAYSYALEQRALYNETNGESGAFVVVTNSSFGQDYGNPDNFPIWRDMYDSLGKYGILSCAATANLNIDIDEKGDMPTACTTSFLIGVTNSDKFDNKNSGAAYGAVAIDLAAPGTDILSTLPSSTYGKLTGTSMATPAVAGAVALLVSAADAQWLASYKTDPAAGALSLRKALLDGVDTLSSLKDLTATGGRLNLYKAIQQIRQTGVIEQSAALHEKVIPFTFRAGQQGIRVRLNSAYAQSGTVTLYSLRGRELDRISLDGAITGEEILLGGASLASGTYLLKFDSGETGFSQKVVVP